MVLAAVVFVLLITFAITYFFYKPIEKLVNAMLKGENRNLYIRIEDKGKGEYGKVYNGFSSVLYELGQEYFLQRICE